jgi:ubiquinone/menaquinone biosynthesis C-methylase UbiE
MRSYYARRAPEYDDWWRGTGLFADRERPGWTAEVEQLVRVLEELPPARTLDVACGTAFLTRHLRGEVTALDQSREMLEIAAPRLPHARLIQAEALPLPFPDAAFERLFTSHFYVQRVAGANVERRLEAPRLQTLVHSGRTPR